MSRFMLVMMVGPTKLPFGYFSTLQSLPSSMTSAPSFFALSMSLTILFLDSGEMTGPRSASGSCPALTFNAPAFAATSFIHSWLSPTITAVVNVLAGRVAAHERDGLDVWVVADEVDGVVLA